MTATQLFTHFDRIADAPDAVPRLRRFILDLAVRGKLVPQDPNDEPASELLKRIAAEKARLVEAGKVRKQKTKSTKMPDTPFELPVSWEWAAIDDVFLYDAGIKREPRILDPKQWLLELEDIEKDTGRLLIRRRASERESKSTKSEFFSGDILYGKLRPYLNKVLVADEPGYSTTEIVAIRSYLPLCSKYCALALRRPDFVNYVTRLGQGTKMPRLRTEDAVIAPFPLPPLAEQHRIVAKVDELMALCDRLEAARAEQEATRNRMATTSLARLDAPDPDSATFQIHAAFALNNLTPLTTRPDQIKALRQTILNLAVRGKLVEQNPNDEPASELLKRIAKNFSRRVAEGKLKNPKPAKALSEKDGLFPLPRGWAVARFNQVAAIQSNLVDPRRYTTLPHIAPDNIESWTARLLSYVSVAEAGVYSGKHLFAAGAILYSKIRPNLAKVAKVDFDGLCSADMYPIHTLIDSDFLVQFMITKDFVAQAVKEENRVAMPKINQSALSDIVVVVPPLAEQHRIVAKVDELMTLCERLETNLTTGDETRTRLMEALLHETLATDRPAT
ncbi:MAG: restriction endonuclease subunit S [Nitrospira sp. SB0677_bin_15]|nr:restriction endonuclease subunit S [Nitrospira sp. SB0677_bin_15]